MDESVSITQEPQQSLESQSQSQSEQSIKIFDKIRFYLINSKNSNIRDELKNNGAIEDKYLTSQLTHVICDDANHSECIEAKELFELIVVKSDWVLESLFTKTLLPVEPFIQDTNRLFSKIIAININLDENLAKKLQLMINYYGGTCVSEINENCTHAISTFYNEKIFENIISLTNNKIKFVTPDWIIDCIDNNNVIDESIYNPKYLITNIENENLINNKTKNEIEEKNTDNEFKTDDLLNGHEQSNKTQIKSRNYVIGTDNFFNQNSTESNDQGNKIIENNTDKNQSPQTANNKIKGKKSRNKLPTTITSTTTNTTTTATTSTNNNSQSNQLNQTSTLNRNKSVTTTTTTSSSFNFDMDEIFQNVIGEAMNNSIVKPKPLLLELIDNKKDFDDNDQNSSLFSLYNETYFTQENSHLIKFNNCLLGCVFYLKDFQNYYSNETLDDWKKMIENYGGKVVNDYELNVEQITHVLCPNRSSNIFKMALKDEKRIVTQFWLEDILEEEKMKPPWRAYHFPSLFDRENGPLKNHIISLHGFREKERLILKTVIYLLNGKFTSYLTKANSLLVSTSDKGAKLDKAKEWNLPIVNGVWLMELYLGNIYTLNENIEERYKVLDIDHFAYDALFVQDLMKPWKTLIKVPIEAIKDISNHDNMSIKSPLKRSLRSLSNKNESTSTKQMRTSSNEVMTWHKPQSNIPIVMFTGVIITDVPQYQKDIISLGGIIAKQPHQTTHLIVNNIDRTAKILKCINYCDYIVTLNWLIDSKTERKFLDPNLYLIKNEEFEKKYDCSIKESLERAKQNGPLFLGFKFYLSPNTRPSLDELQEIVKSSGGQVIRSIPTLKQINDEIDKKYNHSKYIMISSGDDISLFDGLVEKNIPIYNEEFILSGVLRQLFEPNLYRFK